MNRLSCLRASLKALGPVRRGSDLWGLSKPDARHRGTFASRCCCVESRTTQATVWLAGPHILTKQSNPRGFGPAEAGRGHELLLSHTLNTHLHAHPASRHDRASVPEFNITFVRFQPGCGPDSPSPRRRSALDRLPAACGRALPSYSGPAAADAPRLYSLAARLKRLRPIAGADLAWLKLSQ